MPSSLLRSLSAAGLAATALAVTLPLSIAHAAGGTGGTPGRANATTAELKLDVSLLNHVAVPVDVALNKVESPAERKGAMLTANVEGVDHGRPVTLVKAQVGQSTAKADDTGASASVKLVGADVHAPGMPLTALLGLETLSAEADCPVDGQPTAKVIAPTKLTVLGKPVTVGLNSPTHVDIPAVGTVDLEFSKRTTTSTTAAASALDVSVEVNPLNLNVAKVTGRITVASVSCEKPVPAAASSSPAAETTAARPAPSQAGESLAFTGAGGILPMLGAAATLLLAGGAALWMTRRRRPHARHR